jgi:hypothetical protein
VTWAPDYVTDEELKSYLRIGDNADDAFIALWITTVSRNVDDFTGRQFGQTELEERTYPPVWDRHLGAWVTTIDDLQDVTGLEIVDEDGAAVTDYDLEPVNAVKKGRPYEQIITTGRPGKLTATALWGWSAVPSSVPTGMFLQASRLNHRRASPFGIAGSPTEGTQVRLLAQLDPDFRTSLKPYIRDWWAA